MKRDLTKKLQLNRETIRALTTQEMAGIAGGAPKPTETVHTCGCKPPPPPPPSKTCCACTHHCVFAF